MLFQAGASEHGKAFAARVADGIFCVGFDVAIFDEVGQAVIDKPGELVVTKPFLSMPVGFFGDADGSAYRRAYFEMYPDVAAR